MANDVSPLQDRTETHRTGTAEDEGGRVVLIWDGGSLTRALPEVGRLTIGRSEECDIRIQHGSVSRCHAALLVGDAIGIEDLGSFNGTRVAGERIPPHRSTTVGEGDLIEVGAVMVLIKPHRGARAGGASARARETAGIADAARGHDAMPRVLRLLELVARSHLTVLLLGETGAGKEVAARFVHEHSPRVAAPFVKLNCAALPETLIESELFGHDRGAFTGAVHAKQGLLEAAAGGTLLLDEVAELPLAAQAKLLRALENREVTRVGSVVARAIDVRFVSATHRDLDALVATGAFRQDLYFRLNGVSVEIPPLRERRTEIAPLANAFAASAADSMQGPAPSFDPSVIALLEEYGWPGNVRELRNVVERAVVLAQGALIRLDHLPEAMLAKGAADAEARAQRPALRGEIEDLERERIVEALQRVGGHQGRAAALLGISRRTLVNRLDQYGLERPRKGHPPPVRR